MLKSYYLYEGYINIVLLDEEAVAFELKRGEKSCCVSK